MERRILPTFATIFVVAGGICLSSQASNPNDKSEGWKLVSEKDAVTIYSRSRKGSSLKEFKAIGEIDAPSRTVHGVIDDLESYPSFMPYTSECRVLKRQNGSVLAYQRLSPKICSDRDYTLRIWKASWPSPGGLVYLNRWEPANEHGPAEKPGVVRVKVCEGGWLLEPEGTNKTRATYSVYTDTAGLIPAIIANRASQVAISRLFVAIRKQVKNSKYSAAEH